MKKIYTIFIALSLALFGCKGDQVEDQETSTPEYDPITWESCSYAVEDHPCDFTLKDQENVDWNLYDNYGNIIVLDFSAEWCYYCHVAASGVELIQQSYSGESFTYVTILIEDSNGDPATLDLVKNWADSYGITSAPVLVGNRDMIDQTGENGWHVTGWPTFVFIDENMVIRQYIRGYSDSLILTTIDTLLMESKDK